MPVRIASRLYRNRHGMFYFRIVVPVGLRPCVERRDIRLSLGTEQREAAILLALPLIACLPQLFAELREMAEQEETLPPDYFALWREATIKNAALRAKVKLLQSDLDEQQREIDEAQAVMSQMVPVNKVKAFGKLAHEKGQLRGKQETEQRLVFPFPPERTVLFSELKAAYLKGLTYRPAGARKPPPTKKTLDNYDDAIGNFIEVIGDCRIGAIDRELVGEYFTTLKRLPANRNKIARYRDKTIPELLAMNEPGQDESTCSQKIERIATMFKWALAEKRKWGIDANPFSGFGQADSEETIRRPFTRDELIALLNHPNIIQRRFHLSYMYWLIPLAIYTGARLGELCQLDLKDFVEVDGIPCIDINDKDAIELTDSDGQRKKRVKTKNAKRLVPIHSELLRLGILRYVVRLRDAGGVHLFPELNRIRRDGPASAASNWFGRFRKKVGNTVKQETVFHSFRHLFITTILDSGVSPHMLAPIVGHEAELITGQVYWNKKDATKRQPTVETFKLDDDVRQLLPTIEDVTFSRRGSNITP